MRIEIRRQSPDGLSEQLWVFLQFNLDIVLDNYCLGTRPTKRHKFVSVKENMYDRFSRRRSYGDALMDESAIPMPEDVLAEALQAVTSRIRIGRHNIELGGSLRSC